jgi:aerobic carbon-monoxide dehydrogenase small subunit
MPDRIIVNLTVNGDEYELLVSANTTLLEALREKALLTGTKKGCDAGACGACTVIADGEAILSCVTLAVEAQGRRITTIEGLAKEGELSRLQRAFVDHGAVQCGFCSPGFIMSATVLLDQQPHPSREEIERNLAGNLCRCTGYAKIAQAVEAVAAVSADEAEELPEPTAVRREEAVR